MLLLVLAIVILGLLLKKYVAQREQFSIEVFKEICDEAKASDYKDNDGEVNGNFKDYCESILEENTRGVNPCDTCSIKKDDEDNMTGCTRKFTVGEGDERQEMDVSCTNLTDRRCNVCKDWEESDEFKTTMSDDEYKKYMNLPPKDGTPPSSNDNGNVNGNGNNNNGNVPSTLTSSLRNLNNVLTQKLAGDSLSISSNNVSSASSVLTKLDELLQQGDMEQVNNFRNFSYSGGLEDPLPIDSSISSLSGDSELSTFNSQYTRFL